MSVRLKTVRLLKYQINPETYTPCININSKRFPDENYYENLASSIHCSKRLTMSPNFQFFSRNYGMMRFQVNFRIKLCHLNYPMLPIRFWKPWLDILLCRSVECANWTKYQCQLDDLKITELENSWINFILTYAVNLFVT